MLLCVEHMWGGVPKGECFTHVLRRKHFSDWPFEPFGTSMPHRRPRRRVYVLLLLVAAGCDAAPPASPSHTRGDLTPPCRVRVLPLAPSLALAVESAAERWGRAMDCDIAVGSADGSEADENAVTVELALRIDKPDGTQAPGITSDDRRHIFVHAGSRPSQQWATVAHEFCHVFGVGPDHVPGAGLCGGRAARGERASAPIDEAALLVACSALPCAAFSPEPFNPEP